MFSGAAGGQFQLNVMMPVMGDAALESVRLLARAAAAFTARASSGWRRMSRLPGGSREEHGDGHSLESLHRLRAGGGVGEGGVEIGKTVRELAREQKLLPEDQLERALDPGG